MTTAKADAPVRKAAPPRRGNLLLAVLAIIQIGLLVWVVMTVASPRTAPPGPLLTADLSDVTGVTITDTDGSSLALSKVDGDWVLPDADDYPADGTRVQTLLDKLSGLQRNGLVATNASSYARLKVADDTFVRKVALDFGKGDTKTILIGSSPNYGSTHVRLDGDPGVYLERDLRDTDARADANAWIVQTATNIDTDDVTDLELRNANGTFAFHKEGADWVMDGLAAGEALSPNNVTLMVNRLSSLRVHAPVGKEIKPEYGFDDPAAVITLTSQAPAPAATGADGDATDGDAAATATDTSANDASANDATTSANDASASTNDDATTTATDASAADASANATATAEPAAPPVVTTFTVGAKDADGNRYVQVSGSDYVLSVSTANLDRPAEKARADFLVKPDSDDASN